MNNKTVRGLGLTALGMIAAVAIACGGSSDKSDGGGFSTGGFGGGEAVGGDDARGRDLDILLGEQSVANTAPQEAPAGVVVDGAAGPAGIPTSALRSIDRKIIQTASLQLQVEEVGVGFEEVGRIATAAGGFVSSSSFSYRDGDDEDQKRRQVASVAIRVPAEVYPSVLSQLRGLAETVDFEESNASDVTEEFTDMQSRLRNLKATETQLLRLLERAETISDILIVQDRLSGVLNEIEFVKGRLQLIGDLTDLATISVHLRPVEGTPVAPDGGGVDLGETIAEAWDDSMAFLGSIAEGVLTVVVFAWWVPVIGVPAGAIAWGATRNHSHGPASAVD